MACYKVLQKEHKQMLGLFWLFSIVLLPVSLYADDQKSGPVEIHINAGDGTQVFHDQTSADAYAKSRGLPTPDPGLSRIYQAKADAESQAQAAQVNAQMSQEIEKAKAGGYVIDINGQKFGDAQKLEQYSQSQTANGNSTFQVNGYGGQTGIGTAVLPTPRTLSGETVGLSGFDSPTPAPTTQASSANGAAAKQSGEAVKVEVVKASPPTKALVSYEAKRDNGDQK